MKKVNTAFAIFAVAMTLASCGKKETTTSAASPASTVAASSSSGTTYTGNGGVGTVDTGTGTGTTACNKAQITGPVYAGTISAHGQELVSAPFTVRADQLLKAQLLIQPAITNLNSSATNAYTKARFDVTLMKNGVAVPGATYTMSAGAAVGAKSEIINFSSNITPGNSNVYTIQVSRAYTDYTCKNFCTETNYWNQCLSTYGYNNCYYNYQNLVMNMVNSCKAIQCEVGAAAAAAGWKVQVLVENDTTQCL